MVRSGDKVGSIESNVNQLQIWYNKQCYMI